jgi:hypothetical protein
MRSTRTPPRAAYECFVRRVYARGPFPGEVEDLLALLPVELHPPLRRRDLATVGKAEQMDLLEFIERVDDRLGVGLELAEDYARVLRTIGDGEFGDIASELPAGYLAALATV